MTATKPAGMTADTHLYRSEAVRGRRAGAGFVFSAVIHLGVLLALVLTIKAPVAPMLQPAMEVTLMPPSAFPAPPRPRTPAIAAPLPAPKAPRTTEPAPEAPLVAERSQPLERPTAPAPPAPSADVLQFFKKHVPGCGREDFILLSPEEQDRCMARLAAAAAAERRGFQAADRAARPLYGIPDDKRADYERAADARRRRREDPMIQPFQACTGPGSNLGLGCLNPDAKGELNR